MANTIQLQQGWLAIAQGDYDSALTIGNSFLNNTDIQIQQEAHRLMGVVYSRNKSYVQAIPYFEHCIKLIDNPKDRFSLSNCYFCVGELEKAEKIFQSIYFPWSLPAECYLSCAMHRVEHGNFEGAVALLEKAKLSYTLFGISDSHFLYMRQLWPFDALLNMMLGIMSAVSEKFDTHQWLDSFALEMDEEGKSAIVQIKDKIVPGKGPFVIQQLPRRQDYPFLCQVESRFESENRVFYACRIFYGELRINDRIAIYSIEEQAVTGHAKVSDFIKAGKSYDHVQAKDTAGIILDDLIGDLKEGCFLGSQKCESSEYFRQFPIVG